MTTPLEIAVLLNGLASPNTSGNKASFETAITSASSLISFAEPPQINFYDPIVAQVYPDPVKYDLIVLSGGTADPMGNDPWVLKLQDYLRTTVQEFPKQKIVGICWGHQTTCVSFGGSVGSMEGAAEIGVTRIALTAEGKKMFPFTSDGHVRLHEFHAREIKAPAEGFVALAEDNQSFLNESNTIMTFQGHPELNEDLAKALLAHSPAYMGVNGDSKGALLERAGVDHDGVRIWARILEWIRE
ncbi:class I glutamine amidotransferase-like protein [Rhexocercosporidium sp. MPI-PUGE-AT-0058]|nr:class I glutamine amidotransferase-like protein [Rhexocercosporidium sp. MPI-PUGE-AT-0058]